MKPEAWVEASTTSMVQEAAAGFWEDQAPAAVGPLII
jgi:hypothetical protein